MIITIVGSQGEGKSTLVERMVKYLNEEQSKSVVVDEGDGTWFYDVEGTTGLVTIIVRTL